MSDCVTPTCDAPSRPWTEPKGDQFHEEYVARQTAGDDSKHRPDKLQDQLKKDGELLVAAGLLPDAAVVADKGFDKVKWNKASDKEKVDLLKGAFSKDALGTELAKTLFPEQLRDKLRGLEAKDTGKVDLTAPDGPKYKFPEGWDARLDSMSVAGKDGRITAREAKSMIDKAKSLGAPPERILQASLLALLLPAGRDKDGKDQSLRVVGDTDAQELRLVATGHYGKLLAGIGGPEKPVGSPVGDLLAPIKGTRPAENARVLQLILREHAHPAVRQLLAPKK